jgi:hypothetical protein
MSVGTPFTARPSRFGYVTGGLVLLLDVFVVAIIQSRGLLHRPTEAVLAGLIVGVVALYALNDVLVSAVSRVVVDSDAVEVRSQMGRRSRFAPAEVSHAARRSVFAPAQSGIYQEELLLIAKDGRRLTRLWESDYGSANLERLVEALGLKWPETEKATARTGRRWLPSSKRLDYQIAAVMILAVVAVGLAAVAFAVLTH